MTQRVALARGGIVGAVVVAAVLGGVAPGGARAAEGPASRPEPTLADKETARELFRTGDDKFVAGDYQGALAAFAAADAIMGVPTTGLERGRALVELGRLLEARDVLLRVSRLPAEPGESAAFKRARQEAKLLGERVVRRIPAIVVRIAGLDEDAEIDLRVDGAPVPAEAVRFPRRVDPGEHTVVVRAPGHAEVRRTVKVAAGDSTQVAITLVPADDAGDAHGGGLPVLSWIGFGVGAAGLVLGSVAGGITLARVGELDDQCLDRVCSPDEQDAIDQAALSAHLSTTGFAVAGVGVAVGVVAWLVQGEGGSSATRPAASRWVAGSSGVGLRF